MSKYDLNRSKATVERSAGGKGEFQTMTESCAAARMGPLAGLSGIVLSSVIIGLWKFIGLCSRTPQISLSVLVAITATAAIWLTLLR